MAQVKTVPDGYHTLTPYLTVAGADQLIEFAKRVFGAELVERIARPDGAVMHAEMRIGDSVVMVSEACEQMGPMPGSLYVYVEDADATYREALDAGAASIMAPADMFWGDRFSSVKDPLGNVWNIAKHIEDLTPGEVRQRAKAFMAQAGQDA